MRRKFVVSKWYQDSISCLVLSTEVFRSLDDALEYISSVELKDFEYIKLFKL